MSKTRTLVVGVGSPHCDDQAGWRAVEMLLDQVDQDTTVRLASSPIQILDWLDGTQRLIVCDACRGMGKAGQMKRFVWPSTEIAERTWSGTHDFSLVASLQLAQRLGQLPNEVIIWSIEAAAGNGSNVLTRDVNAALPELVRLMVDDAAGKLDSRDKQCTTNP